MLEMQEDDENEEFSSEFEDEVEVDDSEDKKPVAQPSESGPSTSGAASHSEQDLIIVPKKSSLRGRNQHKW